MQGAPVGGTRLEERRVVGEVVVDGPTLDARAARDLGDGGRGRAALEVEGGSRVDDPPPRLLDLLRPLLELVLSRHFALHSVHRCGIGRLYRPYNERSLRWTTSFTCSISGLATSPRVRASRSSSTPCPRARSALPSTGTRAKTSTRTSWKDGSAHSSGTRWSRPGPVSSCRSRADSSTRSGTRATSRCASSRSSRLAPSRTTSASSHPCSPPATR